MSKCLYCKKRIGIFQNCHEIDINFKVHDYCYEDFNFQREKRELELIQLKKCNKETQGVKK